MTNAFHLNTPFNLLLQLVSCREIIILITILQFCTAVSVELIYNDRINVGSIIGVYKFWSLLFVDATVAWYYIFAICLMKLRQINVKYLWNIFNWRYSNHVILHTTLLEFSLVHIIWRTEVYLLKIK